MESSPLLAIFKELTYDSELILEEICRGGYGEEALLSNHYSYQLL